MQSGSPVTGLQYLQSHAAGSPTNGINARQTPEGERRILFHPSSFIFYYL